MIVCPRCSKENQDHYKFCLGCGAELPRDAAQPKSFTAPTPPAGVPTGPAGAPSFGSPAPAPSSGFGAPAGFAASSSPRPASAPPAAAAAPAPAPMPAPAPAPAAAAPATVSCPQCGNSVPPNFKFCGSCGYDMTKAPAAAAPAAAPAAAAAPAPVAGGGGAGSLVLIRPDGSEGESFPLSATTTVGRESGGAFASDSYLSPRHAELVVSPGKATVRDLDSLNGIYVRIARDTPTELVDQAIFRIGQEILRFERLGAPNTHADGTEAMGSPDGGAIGRIRLVIGRDSFGGAFPVPGTGMHLGRERGDVIFPEDGYVSGLHCRIHEENGRVWLTDVGSSNGTFVRVRGQQEVPAGGLMLMGQQLFRLEC
ncbi:MAG: FHA domain-containing protein [Sandaracinus sp.]|nr:FHA domain-containing protein [Sandaracinus sp.]MCB9618451.1 FHA domain-containing protein [Sandaracinus sp.]MCB9624410.1 FHA domain-containing protein [Sandaracinus sp.]MCB9636240.1 FHA domain-containing protein [Sandaracinus sp.]